MSLELETAKTSPATNTLPSIDTVSSADTVLIGKTCINLKTWEVSAEDGRPSRLPEKPFRVLVALLEKPGEVVTRAELQERLWPDGTVVDFDNNLNSAVATLRTVFGDSAKMPTMIETLPRLGYRLVCEVRFDESRDSLLAEARGSEDRPERADSPSSRDSGPALARSTTLVVSATLTLALTILLLSFRFPAKGRSVTHDPAMPSTATTESVAAPNDPSARRAWQRGLYLQAQKSKEEKALAVEAFEEALHHEPDFAPAHVRLAETLADLSFAGNRDLREGLSRARLAATQALSLDGKSAAALRVRSLANLHLDWDFPAAGRDLEAALRLDRQEAGVYLAAATFLSALDDKNAAVVAAQRAVDLDPASSLFKADLGYFLVAAGQYAEALELCNDLLRLEPSSGSALFYSSVAAERLGRFDDSLASALKLMQLRGASEEDLERLRQDDAESALTSFRRWRLASAKSRKRPSAFNVAVRYAGLDQRAEAFALLEQSLDERDPWLVYLHGFSQFHGLREDPRFMKLARSVWARSLNEGDAPRLAARVEGLL